MNDVKIHFEVNFFKEYLKYLNDVKIYFEVMNEFKNQALQLCSKFEIQLQDSARTFMIKQ